MTRQRTLRTIVLAVLIALVAAACGNDDGGEVRTIGGDGSGSVSGSASASGIGSASGSGSASAPGGEVGALGGYMPVSDVSSHANVVLDICEINEHLPSDGPIDDDAVLDLYENGKHSVKSDGTIRTLAGFARDADRDEPIWNDYVAYYGDRTWLDTFVMSAIEAEGAFAGEPDPVRRQGIQKGIQNQIMVAWVFHELVAAMDKAAAGNFDPAGGAPHNWDEAWAFYHGANPDCAPFSTANKRGENFGTGTAVNDALLAEWTRGLEALVAEDAATARDAFEEIKRLMVIPYVQATIRYAHKVDAALAAGDEAEARISQAEGWAFFRVIEPLVAQVDPSAAADIAGRLALPAAPQPGSGPAVQSAIESVYAGLGIDPSEVGALQS